MPPTINTNKQLYKLEDIRVVEVSLVDKAANRRTVLLTKRDGEQPGVSEIDKAEWSRAQIDDLPDSAFLYVEGGGRKDADGKTTPRSLRHFPVKGPDGKVDLPHLRNALARIPQSNLPDDVKAKCSAKGEKMLTQAEKTQKSIKVPSAELGKVLEFLVALSKAEAAEPEDREPAPVEPPPEVVAKLAETEAKLVKAEAGVTEATSKLTTVEAQVADLQKQLADSAEKLTKAETTITTMRGQLNEQASVIQKARLAAVSPNAADTDDVVPVRKQDTKVIWQSDLARDDVRRNQ